MHLKRLIFIIFLICLFAIPAHAQTYTLNPTGGQSDQDVINAALKQVAQDGGGTVYLSAGTYIVTGSIQIQSSNTVLTGDSNAIIQVSSSSSQWFTGTNTIIYSGGYSNIEICGFQIDGNCEKLPFDYHHSRPDTAHDCERAILLAGSIGDFCSNIKVHNMQIYDCFSDGVHIRFANNAYCYSNFISDCQHEGVFYVSVINGLIDSNSVAGITSDTLRVDNGVNFIICNNYLFSYTGDHSSSAVQGEENGVQISDEGASHGYNGNDKPTHTTNGEVYNNTFVNTGSKSVWLDSTGKGYSNVYIHDNKFVGVSEFTNAGTSVSLNATGLNITGANASMPISYQNAPTKETSKRIFSSLFDLFKMESCTQVNANANVTLPKGVTKPYTATGIIEYTTVAGEDYTLVGVPTEGLSEVQYIINGTTETHTRMIGENANSSIEFINTSLWDGNLTHNGDWVQVSGKVPYNQISINCISPTQNITPDIKIVNTSGSTILIEPGVIVIILLLYVIYRFVRFFLKMWFS